MIAVLDEHCNTYLRNELFNRCTAYSAFLDEQTGPFSNSALCHQEMLQLDASLLNISYKYCISCNEERGGDLLIFKKVQRFS